LAFKVDLLFLTLSTGMTMIGWPLAPSLVGAAKQVTTSVKRRTVRSNCFSIFYERSWVSETFNLSIFGCRHKPQPTNQNGLVVPTTCIL